MKTIYLVMTMTMFLIFFEKLNAQSYPYWDAANPGQAFTFGSMGPILATTNAVYGLSPTGDYVYPDAVTRWTSSGGWETLNGLTVENFLWGYSIDEGMMTVHDHYIYAVGFLSIAGYSNAVNNSDLEPDSVGSNYVQIARFDLNTGIWSPLGQNFCATNIIYPTTIALDSSNNIYVGFDVWSGDPWGTTGFAGQLVDLVDVSTNGGTNWQCLGSGLYVASAPGGTATTENAVISAITADGTNVYIGGDFSGSTNGPSPHITMWAGNNWRDLDGVPLGSDGFEGRWNWYTVTPVGLDTINSIVSIGTNIYAAGSFAMTGSPNYSGLVRFSNVTGHLLPTGDPADFLGWSTNNDWFGATALAVNNGILYFGGIPYYETGLTNAGLASLSDPQAPSPSQWTNLSTNSANSLDVAGAFYLAAATNGNAVYVLGDVYGTDSFGNSSDGFSRWLVGPDSCPTVYITNGVWATNMFSFEAVGTSGSHWQVVWSPDTTNWTDIGAITLWGGTNVLTYTNTDNQPDFGLTNYYQLTNNCDESPIFTFSNVVSAQFGNAGDPQQVGIAGTGVTTNDYWNIVPAETNFNEYGYPVYISGGVFGGYAVSDVALLDQSGIPSGINLFVLTGISESGDAPYTQYADYIMHDPNPLINEELIWDNGPLLGLSLPAGHTYDVYLYSVTQYSSGYGARYPATFTITNYSGPYGVSISDWSAETPSTADYPTDTFVEGNQYIVFRGLVGGAWTISATSEIEPVVNGIQIVVH